MYSVILKFTFNFAYSENHCRILTMPSHSTTKTEFNFFTGTLLVMFLYAQVFLLLSVTPSQMLIFMVETNPVSTVTFPKILLIKYV